jgi:hypothetical protein
MYVVEHPHVPLHWVAGFSQNSSVAADENN